MPPLRFALFGHPVSHSISPSIHRAAFAELGLPHTYLAIDLGTDEDLVNAMQAIDAARIAGANVTAPHKRRALELADRIAPSAEGVGAANVLCRDPGRSRVRAAPRSPPQHRCRRPRGRARRRSGRARHPDGLVLGAGGAALAAVVALKRRFATPSASPRDPSPLRSPPRPSPRPPLPRARRVPVPFPGAASPSPNFDAWIKRASVIVQATSAGTQSAHDPSSGEALAALIPWDQVDPEPWPSTSFTTRA
jgi:shikimate 5-dehydrogenase